MEMAQRKELGSSSRPGKQRQRALTSARKKTRAIKPCEPIGSASAHNNKPSVAPLHLPHVLCSMISCILTPTLIPKRLEVKAALGKRFDWTRASVVGNGTTKRTREFIEAWKTTPAYVNQCTIIDPCYKALRAYWKRKRT